MNELDRREAYTILEKMMDAVERKEVQGQEEAQAKLRSYFDGIYN